LMGGEGSRFRHAYSGQARLCGSDEIFLKPFVSILGRPLIWYTLQSLMCAEIKRVHFVVGYETDRMIEEIRPLIPSGVTASFIENRDWRKENGISVLMAANRVGAPFLLGMSDHLFDDAL